MEKEREASVAHVIRDEKLVIFGETVSSQTNDVTVSQPSEHFHSLLELSLPSDANLLQPLHRHHGSVIQHRFVGTPKRTLPQHLRRRTQQLLQLKPPHPFQKHHSIIHHLPTPPPLFSLLPQLCSS